MARLEKGMQRKIFWPKREEVIRGSWCEVHLIESIEMCFLGAFPKLRKPTRGFRFVCPSFRPHETTRLLLDGFWRNLIFKFFFDNLSRNSSFIKTWQGKRVLSIKTFSNLWRYLAEFFLKMRNALNKSCRENQNAHFMFSFFPKIVQFIRLEKYIGTRDHSENMTHARCMVCK
jgi:hypothetical protein